MVQHDDAMSFALARQVPRLVLTSHGAEVSAQLRKAAVRALASKKANKDIIMRL